MGPSGAGKTSLLNILAGRMSSGGRMDVQSSIRLDNTLVDTTSIRVRQKIAFVAQDDSLLATATPREAILFSARLRLGRTMTSEQLNALVETMLIELGLVACADTIVGGPLLKGISGGERKRTSVGVELIVKPSMVFLDEPTSGLDSFSAVQVCQMLKKVARAGASVLFTIHQPSSRIFREFDHLILLNKGRVMYQGPVPAVADYFGARGHACPRNYNPADWMMKVAQKVSVDELERCGFYPKDERDMGKPSSPQEMAGRSFLRSTVPRKERPPNFLTEISMLVQREATHIRRNKTVTVARVIQTAVLSTLVGMIFYKVGGAPNTSVVNLQSHFGAIVMTSCIIMMGPAQAA
jgi:ABC-type multidrug transport system ATPase subunit